MEQNPTLAIWLVNRRHEIQQHMDAKLGAAAPAAGADESEVLRRFRSYATSALQRGEVTAPALDGLRIHERRVASLLDAWTDSAVAVADASGSGVRDALAPLTASFRTALKGTGSARRKSGAPRTTRRAVAAAIDRVCDGFLAIDTDALTIVDANPAAGAMLGVARDALLGVDARTFLPEKPAASAGNGHPAAGATAPTTQSDSDWMTRIDAVCEGVEAARFRSELRDAHGSPVPVDCTLTRFATRARVLALLVARDVDQG